MIMITMIIMILLLLLIIIMKLAMTMIIMILTCSDIESPRRPEEDPSSDSDFSVGSTLSGAVISSGEEDPASGAALRGRLLRLRSRTSWPSLR